MGRGRSLGTAVDRGQGTLSGKFKAEKSIHRKPLLVFKDKKDNLFIFKGHLGRKKRQRRKLDFYKNILICRSCLK